MKTAGSFGIGADRAANYHSDKVGTWLNFQAVSGAISTVRCSVPLDAGWKQSIDEDYRNRK